MTLTMGHADEMDFKMSSCVCVQTPRREEAKAFYSQVLGLKVVEDNPDEVELDATPFRLFIDQGEPLGPILEVLVPDLIDAREALEAAGCTVVRWEGPGRPCYMLDPFGLVFNLFEDPAEFTKPPAGSD